MPSPLFSVNDQPVETLPQCPGVYRFLSGDSKALYIGKSVNLRTRVRTHLSGGRARLLHATERIDCRPTAGEAGALLLENAAIKAEAPPFNRRQRAVRQLWSITLHTGRDQFLKPQVTTFASDNRDILTAYGCFSSQRHARLVIENIAREAGLCPQRLGLSPGRGPCFQHQLKHCRGACVGREDAQTHDQRLLDALVQHQLSAWPITQPVLLLEEAADRRVQPPAQWHLLHNWMYMGTYPNPDSAAECTGDDRFMFDRDTYRLLRGILNKGQAALYCAGTLEPVNWPNEQGAAVTALARCGPIAALIILEQQNVRGYFIPATH